MLNGFSAVVILYFELVALARQYRLDLGLKSKAVAFY